MMQRSRITRFFAGLSCVLAFLLCAHHVYAGGAAVRRRQQMQGTIHHKQMIEVQRTVVQQQIQQQTIQRQLAIQQQAVMQEIATQQRAVAEQAIGQQRAVQQMTIQKAREEALKQQAQQGMAEVKEIATLDQVIASLEHSSHAWPLIIDPEAKIVVVSQFIKRYEQQGVRIRKPLIHYAQLIDAMSTESSEMLMQPFPNILRIIAVIEYDFDNGQNQDALAQQVLGTPEAVMQNKMRLGIQ